MAVGAATAAAVARSRLWRFEVAGESMLPGLRPGDWLAVDRRAYRHRHPCEGEVVVIEDPREPSRTLAERVQAVGARGEVMVAGDNPGASTDSRHFGPVPRRGLARPGGRALLALTAAALSGEGLEYEPSVGKASSGGIDGASSPARPVRRRPGGDGRR